MHSVISFFLVFVPFILIFGISEIIIQESDGEKSDQDLVVDVANEMVSIVSLKKNQKKKHTKNRTVN